MHYLRCTLLVHLCRRGFSWKRSGGCIYACCILQAVHCIRYAIEHIVSQMCQFLAHLRTFKQERLNCYLIAALLSSRRLRRKYTYKGHIQAVDDFEQCVLFDVRKGGTYSSPSDKMTPDIHLMIFFCPLETVGLYVSYDMQEMLHTMSSKRCLKC